MAATIEDELRAAGSVVYTTTKGPLKRREEKSRAWKNHSVDGYIARHQTIYAFGPETQTKREEAWAPSSREVYCACTLSGDREACSAS